MTLRQKTREASQAAKDKEITYLVYWGEDEGVSIHPGNEVEGESKNIGDPCIVKFKGAPYSGKIAFSGKKADVIMKEKMYLNGTFTPFQQDDHGEQPLCNTDTNDPTNFLSHISTQSGSTVCHDNNNILAEPNKKRKRKRKRINNGPKVALGAKKRKKSQVHKLYIYQCLMHCAYLLYSYCKERCETKYTSTKKKKGSIIIIGSGASSSSCNDSENGFTSHDDETAKEEKESEQLHIECRKLENERQKLLEDIENLRCKKSSLTVSEQEIVQEEIISDAEESKYEELQAHEQDESASICKDISRTVKEIKVIKDTMRDTLKSLNNRLNIIEKELIDQLPGISNPLIPVITPTHPSEKANPFLKKLIIDKEESPLPAINRSALIKPEEVVEKYPKLLTPSKIPTLAVRLSKEAYFGKQIMGLCTVRGTGIYHALPEKELADLKMFLHGQCHPRFTATRMEFENIWRACVESVGQACKSLRTPKENAAK